MGAVMSAGVLRNWNGKGMEKDMDECVLTCKDEERRAEDEAETAKFCSRGVGNSEVTFTRCGNV
jgi:hypothetical protein